MGAVQTKRPAEFQFDLTGGNLSLNFANTISRRDDPERCREHLDSYSDLISFARQSELISVKQAGELRSYAQQHDSESRQSFRKAILLREALYRAFSAIAQGRSAVEADLELISDFTAEGLQHRYLERANGSYRWEWRPAAKNPLDRITWAAAQSAADLLTSDELKLVRFCEAPDCEWLFLDRSRNRSRRWCDMTSCGNRQKARRHYQRAHA
jgi:predicted RNA-binding Zn ribbon-like protein